MEKVEEEIGPSAFYVPVGRAPPTHKRSVDSGGGTEPRRRHLGTGLAEATLPVQLRRKDVLRILKVELFAEFWTNWQTF